MSVLKKFNGIFETRISQLYYQGYTIFDRYELLAWYNKDKVTKVVWQDIQESWEDFYIGKAVPEKKKAVPEIHVIKGDETTTVQKYIVVNVERLIDIEDMS